MYQQFWFQQLRAWSVAVALGCVLLTTGCNQTTTPEAIVSSPSPSPSAIATVSPVASPTSQGDSKEPVQFTELARLEGKATVVMVVKGAPITLEIDGTNAPITA